MNNDRRTAARALALLLCVAVASGCATSTGGMRVAPQPTPESRAALVEYLMALPSGSAVRVGLADGGTMRGSLLKATEQSVVIQVRTRIPEPPLEIPMAQVVGVTPDRSNGNAVARAIGIGAVAGAGAALAVFLIIIAAYAD